MKSWINFLVLMTSIASTSTLLASGGIETGNSQMLPVTHAKWKAECSSCHTLYHPNLLPEKSWNKIMAGLDQHFGENASLDAITRDEITRFLALHSAEKSDNRRAQRINQSISASDVPIRITQTRYFMSKHDEISASTFKRKSIGSTANCIACHQGAEKGNFSESQVKIPR